MEYIEKLKSKILNFLFRVKMIVCIALE